ncbi:MAG: MFS transporter, partial [Coriobacteriia bacterium]|nr:MFS transporter [Coriobacteriia bacterium]
MQVKQVERWLRLALGALVLLFVGIIYAWAILKTPFAGEFGWDAGQLSLNYTLTIVAFCIGGFIAGMLSNKTTPRLRLIVAAVLLFGGFFLASRLTGDNIWLLYLTYGVMSGTGVGFAYTTIIGLTNAWFPDKKGLCSGVLLMSFGLTSLIIGNLADLMIKTPAIGWRTTFLVLAIAEGVVLVAASLFVKAPAEGTIFPLAKSEKPKSSSGG